MAKDYYETLGISKNATPDDIKKAFRQAARKYHPDVNKASDASAKFKELNEAYQVLSDPQKKQQYDTFGRVGAGGGAGGFDFSGFGGGSSDFSTNFEGFSDIFDAFFSGSTASRRRTGTEHGSDLRYDLTINLEDAAKGTEIEIEISHLIACETCRGSGAKPGSKAQKCSKCGGSGQVRQVQRTILGSFTQITVCPVCQGAGESISSPCSSCNGRGRQKGKHKVKIKIPAGIESGTSLRVPQAGNAGPKNGLPGDLYVYISVKEHPLFERDGSELIMKRKIPFPKAALGGEIEIQTLIDGRATVKIPAGTQSGSTFRFKNKGMPHLQHYGRGDLYVRVEIDTPADLDDRQRELLKEFGRLRGEL